MSLRLLGRDMEIGHGFEKFWSVLFLEITAYNLVGQEHSGGMHFTKNEKA